MLSKKNHTFLEADRGVDKPTHRLTHSSHFRVLDFCLQQAAMRSINHAPAVPHGEAPSRSLPLFHGSHGAIRSEEKVAFSSSLPQTLLMYCYRGLLAYQSKFR